MGVRGHSSAPGHDPGLVQLGGIRPSAERSRLEQRARLLAWGGIAWHIVEFAIAAGAGIAAGSIALIGFGADSFIEAVAGLIVVWLFTGARRGSHAAERRAQILIAVTFFLLAVYVGVEAVRALAYGEHARVSWIGIGLAAFTAATMPLLAAAKRRVGTGLHSAATVKEAGQTQLCAYLSIALLVGLGANALFGWWWTVWGTQTRVRLQIHGFTNWDRVNAPHMLSIPVAVRPARLRPRPRPGTVRVRLHPGDAQAPP